ncbi:MAG: ribbon-helix-helix domain-containing protein [Acidimicrobiaceae bacterium]|nr:ribbon-helix-helix domain-containing protein [Acidimicrobiaceae bacterium]
MAQLVTRINDELAERVDELVAEGAAKSRSDAVRQSLRLLIDQHQRRRTAEAIVRGYQRHPQTPEEVGWADEATVAMIAEESW